ncbi:TetR-like C-terminal domain-containing protein [Paenibacillus kribbensis]|uniref:TetR/AcrR family transcriptional regulator n=1 Tax=Paenibacillus kribbensis TaxID=172713 RepID=UPI0015C13BC4|nr:TetR-like C-terminal domain-containing protein [Paenibacillus kribbensis]MEC0236063.1 TetR-like C-terminal domain-containing protein [Paenibacillus kribbensis]
MTSEKTDLRVIRSRRLIQQALLDILMNQGIKELNVKNVTQRAGINRGTFYLHYKDIFDLIEQTEIMRGLLDIFEPIDLNQLMLHEDEELPFPAFVQAFEYLQTHAYFFKAVFHSSAPSELRDRLQFLVGTRLYENLKQDHPHAQWSTYPSGYLIAYLGNAQFGLIQHWFMKDQSLPPAEIARLLTRFIKTTPCLSHHFQSENNVTGE